MNTTMMNLVSEEELSIERSSPDLINWVEMKFDEIAKIEGGKNAVRMRKGKCKELVEEVYPLSIFASKKYDDRKDVYLTPVIGNQNYDSIINDGSECYKLG